jgi:hypothetical protein
VRQGTQEAVNSVLEKLKSGLGEVGQAVGKANQTIRIQSPPVKPH